MMINHIITSSLIIIFVLIMGTIFENKISACLKYSLWLLVAVRLLLPIPGVESKIHIINYIRSFTEVAGDRIEMLTEEETDLLLDETLAKVDNTSELSNHIVSRDFGENLSTDMDENQKTETSIVDEIAEKTNGTTTVFAIIKGVYLAGVFGTLSIIIVSNLRFRKSFKKNRKYVKTYKSKITVYKIDDYYGACLYGGFIPVIIVGNNKDLSIEQQHMILLHEYIHYIHGDHIWSMIRSLCVALYWFNPLVWLAASVSRRDGELACDEGTMRRIGKKQRIAYGQTLLEIVAKSSGKKDIMSTAFLNFTMVSGGKDEMKKRIMMISKGRKTSRIALILAIILSMVCIGCTFGEPVKEGVQGTDSSVSVQKIESNDFQGGGMTEDWYSNQVFDLFDEIPNAFQEDTNVESETKSFFWPTESRTISNGFGERIHPISGERKMIDYMVITGNEGDAVYTIADGDIIDIGYDHILGNYIILGTATGEEVTYGHLDGSKVPKGGKVKAGEIIGVMGKSGNATGPILSISVKVDGKAVDPMIYFKTEFFLEETIIYNGKECKKSELCNATLKWLELSELERSYSSYFPPEFMIFDDPWGITLTVEDITSTGLTIVCKQSGGKPTGRLQTGSWFILETWTKENGWQEVPLFMEVAWTEEAWSIPQNDSTLWEVNWEWLYGVVPSGKYRIGKRIMDFRSSGDFDNAVYYAEFII